MNTELTYEERLEFLQSHSIQELQKLLYRPRPQRGMKPETYKRILILEIIKTDNEVRRVFGIVKNISNRKSNKYAKAVDLNLWSDLTTHE